MKKPILDDAQYNNFFRILSLIVHSDNYNTPDEKKAALYEMINDHPEEEEEVAERDKMNLEEFVSWFDEE